MKQLRDQDVAPRRGPAVLRPQDGSAAPADSQAGGMMMFRLAGLLFVLTSPILLGWGAWSWMTRTPGFAIRSVTVTGNVNASAEALAARSGARGVNAFALDLAAVRGDILGDPWIAEARVRRVLPHDLRIVVTEREPVAREPRGTTWRVVDGEGRVLSESAQLRPALLALPEIRGLERVSEGERDGRRALAAATLVALKDAAPRLHARTEALEVAESGKLVLVAADCPPLWLAGPESVDEAAAWSRREQGIMTAIGRAAWVDARWRDRLHVMPEAAAPGTVTSTRTRTEVIR